MLYTLAGAGTEVCGDDEGVWMGCVLYALFGQEFGWREDEFGKGQTRRRRKKAVARGNTSRREDGCQSIRRGLLYSVQSTRTRRPKIKKKRVYGAQQQRPFHMDDSPQDVYAECLPNHRGLPLWFPEPSSTLPSSYRQDGLQIGDVGFLSRNGIFNVLLNICYGPHHALHRRPGVTLNFDPIALDIDREVNVISNADPPGCIITSPGITQVSQRYFSRMALKKRY